MNSAAEDWDDMKLSAAIDMRAADFVERRDGERWTEKDEATLATWLSESFAHRVAFLRLNSSWKRTERLIALRSPEHEDEVLTNPGRHALFLRVGAIFALMLIVAGAAAEHLLIPHYETYATAVGGRQTLTLQDGSEIELNTDTHVQVSQNTWQRLVRLDSGEAFFQVRHDSAHPFVVIAAGERLVDLGTKFSARADAGGLHVALVEGRLRVEATDFSGHPRRTVLSPGDLLVASAGGISVKKKASGDLKDVLAWRQGMLAFHGTTLADAAIEFNRYNETKIIIDDPEIERDAINGTMPANDLREFSRMARNIFGIRTIRRGNAIVLTR